jgi:Kyanoviridae head maturation protease
MILLHETNKANVIHQGKKVFLEGIFLAGNVLNKNSRIYKSQTLSDAVDRVQSQISSGNFMGQLGHSDSPTLELSRVSHIVEKLERKGDNWIGRARVIDEGAGKILKSIISAGGQIGVSSAGLGDIKEDNQGRKVVQNYELLHIDAVHNPSTGASVKALSEGITSGRYSINESATALRILEETSAANSVKPTGARQDA